MLFTHVCLKYKQFNIYRDLVAVQSSSLLLTVYDVIYKAIQNPEQGYTNPNSILPRTPDQVKTLLNLS